MLVIAFEESGMPKSGETQIDLASTPYYHVYSRCVRQAYLFDSESGIDYKQLFVDRIKALSSVFCIDIAAYAVMSNLISYSGAYRC